MKKYKWTINLSKAENYKYNIKDGDYFISGTFIVNDDEDEYGNVGKVECSKKGSDGKWENEKMGNIKPIFIDKKQELSQSDKKVENTTDKFDNDDSSAMNNSLPF